MLEKLTLGGLAIGAAWYALSGGQSADSQKFVQPAETAIQRIETKHRVVNGTGLGSLTIESAGRDGQASLIRVKKAGALQAVKCRVTISPLSPGESSAEVDCTQPGADDQPARRLGVKAITIVMREHVAATIEDRPYDIDGVANRMIAFAAINGPALAASMKPPRN